MAAINILAKSDSPVDWKKLFDQYPDLDQPKIEAFPIPKELGFDSDSAGINVHRGYEDRAAVLIGLKKVIDLFERHKFKLVELYDGVEINSGNFDAIMKKLLPE